MQGPDSKLTQAADPSAFYVINGQCPEPNWSACLCSWKLNPLAIMLRINQKEKKNNTGTDFISECNGATRLGCRKGDNHKMGAETF